MSNEKQLVIIGSGFAGVWAALAAERRRRELGMAARISVVSPSAFLGIRPRFHEDDLARSRIELAHLFEPVGIHHVQASAVGIDPAARRVTLDRGSAAYDALIVATGSAMVPPNVAGAEHIHSVDTHAEAEALRSHLQSRARGDQRAQAIVVVGAGFTGIEVAAELVARVPGARIVLVERAAVIAPDFGPRARTVIVRALGELGIEMRTQCSVSSVTRDAVALTNGEVIPASAVIWNAGLRASPLGRALGDVDEHGRVRVDACLRVDGAHGVWAAGDLARVHVDRTHLAVMSCQHASPQGRYAGHNAMSWLGGATQETYSQHMYLTCLDLGPWGALLTRGFARNAVLCEGAAAKKVKQFINTSLIYPPLTGDAAALLGAAAPEKLGAFKSALRSRLLGIASVRDAFVASGTSGPAALEAARARRPNAHQATP